jgi:hypothetical protein
VCERPSRRNTALTIYCLLPALERESCGAQEIFIPYTSGVQSKLVKNFELTLAAIESEICASREASSFPC